jgi:hypothetical protein
LLLLLAAAAALQASATETTKLCAYAHPAPVEEAAAAVEHVPQLVSVSQVAVVDQVDAQRAVHKEGLRLLR